MSETRVVHVDDRVAGAVYVGRANARRGLAASPFANPYKIVPGFRGRTAAIELFRDHLLDSPDLLAGLPELRGRPLACWCRHDGEAPTEDNRCHADVLVEFLTRFDDALLRAMRR